ncbi:MAG: hypothetical protein ACJASQ_000014 [Crocinitomicaceae bacterium]|jgi:hypothetical protein
MYVQKLSQCIPTFYIDSVNAEFPYLWIDGLEYNTPTITPTFVLIGSTGCDSTITLHLTEFVSVAGLDMENTVRIFPNPSHGSFTIYFGGLQSVSMRILDSKGCMVAQKSNINTQNYHYELQ